MRNVAIISDLGTHRIVSRPRAVTVTGTTSGDFYTDDVGGKWRYEYQSSGSLWGQTRGITNLYGGVTTAWYDQSAFSSHPSALEAKMDTMATTWTDTHASDATPADTTPSDATPSDTTPTGGGDTTPSGGSSTTPRPKAKAGASAKPGTAPVAKAASGSSSLLIAGLIAIPLAVGAIWMWMRSSAAASASPHPHTPAPTPAPTPALAPAPSSGAASPPLLSASSSNFGGVL